MHRICLIAAIFVILASMLMVSQAGEISRPAIKDSTILRSTVSCPECPDRNCYMCLKGHEETLQVNTGGHAYVRALIGFKLPLSPSRVRSCSVEFAAFSKPLEYGVNVTLTMAESSNWDEDTVTGENAPAADTEPFLRATVPPNTNIERLNITSACKKAAGSDYQFSIYLGSEFGSFEMPSLDAAWPALLYMSVDI